MIPIHLSITGFLSYREPAEIDFTAFDLACIAGSNGAGKSSILDALTWALFGQARKRDDSLIHQRSALADVALIFGYEGNIYKVRRIKPRDKTMSLEFQILQGDGAGPANEQIARGTWKPLTERTLRETEARIEQTLRMDFETFTNASFFLQGKADQFTQQRPGDRKRILGSILGLDAWESYRGRAVERRRGVESEITALDGRLREISEELSEEQARRERLEELGANLKRVETLYAWQEAGVQIARQEAARLEEQKRMLDVIARQLESSSRRLEETRIKLFQRQQEQQSFSELLGRAEQIEADHVAWQKKRVELAGIEKVAEQFREIEKQREAPRTTIQAERARLEQERDGLIREQEQILQGVETAVELNRQRETASQSQLQAETRSAQRGMLEAQLLEKRQQQADQRAENSSLKPEMERLKERIERLRASDAADCPLCGQPLSASDRLTLIERLEADGKEMGDRYRENLAKRGQIDQELEELSAQIAEMGSLDAEIRQYSNRVAVLDQQLECAAVSGRRLENERCDAAG